MKNYKLSDETKTLPCGTVLHRVVATTTFTLACGLTIDAGDVGGWIEKESNLSGNAWVSDNAMVYSDAKVYDDAQVYSDAQVSGNAQVYGNARVSGRAQVYDAAQVYGDAEASCNARVYGNARVYDNAEVSDRAWVYGDAWVYDNAEVYGDAWVYGYAEVYGDAWVYGYAEVYGDAKVMNISDYTVFKNSWSSSRYFTWTKSNDMWAVGCFYGTGDELIKKAYADGENSGKHYEAFVKLVETMKAME